MTLDRDEFNAFVARVYSGLDGINARLDLVNGRTRKAEEHIAVLESQSQPTVMVDIARLETRINVYAAVFGAALGVGVPVLLFVAGKLWR